LGPSNQGREQTHRDPDHLSFTVGGVPDADRHLEWDVPEVSVGDEITIRIIETDGVRGRLHARLNPVENKTTCLDLAG